jgi:membrane protein implicated in regulation of membrane protease activity
MGTALVVVGVSLVVILAISAAVALVWRKRVLRRRDESPEDRYRRAAQDIRGSGDGGPSDEPRIRPSRGTGGNM